MNLTTYSPALVLLFVWAMLWMMMDIRWQELTPRQRCLAPMVIVTLAVFNHLLRAQVGSLYASRYMWLTMHLPFYLLFLYLTRCGPVKMAFMILSAFVFTAPTVIISDIVTVYLAQDSSWALLLSNLISYAAVLLLIKRVFRSGFNYLLKYGTDRLFLQFSVVPFIYYCYVFAALNVDFSSVLASGGVFVRYFPTIEAFVFYFMLINVYRGLNERRELETSQTVLTRQLDAAGEQIALLNDSQAQTAVYQHDIRHHMNVLEGLLEEGKPRQAADYIRQVQEDVEAFTPRRFCENEMFNLLCSSYAGKAARMDTVLTADVTLPAELDVSSTELGSVLSNGLENALRAVSELKEADRWISLYSAVRLNKLLIEIKNPYAGRIVLRDGLPVSGRAGHGYGCRSIRTIAERHGGFCEFSVENNVFLFRFVLPLKGAGAVRGEE